MRSTWRWQPHATSAVDSYVSLFLPPYSTNFSYRNRSPVAVSLKPSQSTKSNPRRPDRQNKAGMESDRIATEDLRDRLTTPEEPIKRSSIFSNYPSVPDLLRRRRQREGKRVGWMTLRLLGR